MNDDTNVNAPRVDNSYKTNNNSFSTIAIIFGIFAVLTSTTVFISIFFGALGIIFAVLSKGKYTKMGTYGKLGFDSSVIAIIISITILFYALYSFAYNAEYRSQVDALSKQLYGVTATDLFNETINEYKELYTGEVSPN